MTNDPKRDPIDALRRANPASAEDLRAEQTAGEVEAARERAIAIGESSARAGEGRPRVLTRAGLAGGFAVAAACAVVVLLALGGDDPVGEGTGQAFAGQAIEVAEANPRFLIDAPGWSVTDVNEFQPASGGMNFERGDATISLSWEKAPAEWTVPEGDLPSDLPQKEQWYRLEDSGGCASDHGPVPCDTYLLAEEITAAGETAILSDARIVTEGEPWSNLKVTFPAVEDTLIRIYTTTMSHDELVDALSSLTRVDVDTWLAALPDSAVEPLERPDVIDEMLADMPVPDSVDIEWLKEAPIAARRYSVGAQVTRAVACAWLDQWAAARESGDEVAAEEAVAAMETSREWDILIEMDGEGDWPETIWQYAREMRDEPMEALDSGGTETFNGITYELSPSYAMGLGCDSLVRTALDEQPNYAKLGNLTPVEAPPSP